MFSRVAESQSRSVPDGGKTHRGLVGWRGSSPSSPRGLPGRFQTVSLTRERDVKPQVPAPGPRTPIRPEVRGTRSSRSRFRPRTARTEDGSGCKTRAAHCPRATVSAFSRLYPRAPGRDRYNHARNVTSQTRTSVGRAFLSFRASRSYPSAVRIFILNVHFARPAGGTSRQNQGQQTGRPPTEANGGARDFGRGTQLMIATYAIAMAIVAERIFA